MNELEFVKTVNSLGHGTILDKITILISDLYFLSFLIILVLTFVYFKSRTNFKWLALTLLLALVIDIIIVEGLFKNLFLNFWPMRIRPYIAFPNEVLALGVRSIDSSFPSAHMAGTVAILTAFVSYFKKSWVWALIITLLMAFVRLHNGMHYLSDVLAGIVVGFLCGLIGILITNILKKRRNNGK